MTKRTKEVERLSMRIRPLLAGLPPEIIGAVLADLVSVFIVSHLPGQREEVLALHVGLVRDLVPETEKEIFPHGRPPGWEAN